MSQGSSMLTSETLAEKYELVVGLEVHAQLSTKTKLFCSCATNFGAPPNSHVCPVCLGMPGTLPVLNKKAFEHSLRLAIAFDCKVPAITYFDRKNYYYPDLPKNYQISQDNECIGVDGEILLIKTGKKVRIHNIHLEEDAGKLVHPDKGASSATSVDLNRAGTPLAEIVTMPDFRCLEDIEDYMETLRTLLLYLDASDGKMQEGSLRFEASISVRIRGTEELGKRSEIKNLNSFKAVLKAVQFEYARQIAALEAGLTPSQETRLWNEEFDGTLPGCKKQWQEDVERPDNQKGSECIALEAVLALLPTDFKGRTRVMRSKEGAADYRYFPEPDLISVPVSREWIDQLRSQLPTLPGQQMALYTAKDGDHQLDPYHAEIIVKDRDLNAYVVELLELGMPAKRAANYTTNHILALINNKDLDINGAANCPIRPADLHALDQCIQKKTVTRNMALGKVFQSLLKERLAGSDKSLAKIIEQGGFAAQRDEGQIMALVKEAMSNNAKALADIDKGKMKARGALVGYVMKKTRGKAPPDLVNQLLDKALEARSKDA